MIGSEAVRMKYEALAKQVDERSDRLCLAGDARAMGHGGVSRVAEAAGVSRTTIYAGLRELNADAPSPDRPSGRVRRAGGGRKARSEQDPTLLEDLDRLLAPVTRGDPMSRLRWNCTSPAKLTQELRVQGHTVSQATVWRLLDGLGYSMQSNRKTRKGSDHPDRNGQLEFINATVQEFLGLGLPVISVDTKRKELIDRFKKAGKEWHKKEPPEEVNIHDFRRAGLGQSHSVRRL